jgi:eukaryotic-like serine/threonine-protein kinase
LANGFDFAWEEEQLKTLAAGTVLGRIRLVRPLGHGSMGTVWKGQHIPLDLPVAVKVLRNLDPRNPSQHRQYLRREAQLTSRLNHPSIVRVHDYIDDEHLPCIVMELVEGTTLSAYLRSRGSFSERTALLMVFQLSGALAAAHDAGILHRDIKPSNVLITSEGILKLSDFGLAQPLATTASTPRHILGTPVYMAPEYFSGGSKPDQRCDLYSLGVILYELLTGSAPFEGSTTELIQAHLHSQPDLSRIPPGSRHIVERMLEKDPRKRVASAREVRELLRARGQAIDLHPSVKRDFENDDSIDPCPTKRTQRLVVSEPCKSALRRRFLAGLVLGALITAAIEWVAQRFL